MNATRLCVGTLGLLLAFCVLASGAHDFWAATLVYVVVLSLVTAVLLWRCWPNGAPGFSVPAPAALACAALALTFSFLYSIHPAESWFALMDWLAAALVFLTVVNTLREDRPLQDLLAFMVPLVCFECGVILYQHWALIFAADAPHGAWALMRYIISGQVPGTLVNSSVATSFFLLWTPVLVCQAWSKWKAQGRISWFWTVGAAVSVLGIVALDSNWGMVCLAAGVPLMGGPRPLLKWIRRNPRLAMGAAAAGLLAFSALLAWKFGHTHNANAQPLPPGETTRRFYWWASGLQMFRDYPWLGVGLGNFPSAYLAYKVGAVQNTLYPHNFVIGLLAETGILGTTGLAVFLFGVLYRLASNWEKVEGRWPFLLGLMMFALFGVIGLSLEYLVNLVTCGLFLGILAAPVAGRGWKPRQSVLLVLSALCVCVVPSLITPFAADRACVDGEQLLKSGDASGAARRFASASALDANSSHAHHGWARALAALSVSERDIQKTEEAAMHQQRAAELDRLHGILWWELGGYQRALGREAEALESFDKAVRLRAPRPD